MKLDEKEFKEFKRLVSLKKAKKLDAAGEARLAELEAKKNEKGSNDLAWWKNYPEVLASVATVPFNHIAGEAYPFKDPVTSTPVDMWAPGLAVVHYLPTIGKSEKSSDAYNSQMRQLWLDMHRKYRGIGTYQASDLGITIFCIYNLFCTIAKFERIYSIVNTYKIQNRNMPFTLVNALGIGRDILDHVADFRAQLNYRISKLQQLCLPKGIAAIQNEMILNMFVFKDSDNARASLFVYDPEYYYVYEPNVLSTGGAAFSHKFIDEMTNTTPGGFAGFSSSNVMKIIDDMMDALLADDDVAKICSDLIAAYGPENVMNMPYIPENLLCSEVHDYERKLQFNNLTIVGRTNTAIDKSPLTATDVTNIQSYISTGLVIYQANDVIINRLATHVGPTASWIDDGSFSYLAGTQNVGDVDVDPLSTHSLLNTFVDNPSEVETVCGTRLTSLCSNEKRVNTGGVNYYYSTLETFGLEVVTSVTVWTKVGASCQYTDLFGQVINDNVAFADLSKLLTLNQFDWNPQLYVLPIGDVPRLVSDVDNARTIDIETLSPIHDVAIYSAFKIPAVSYIS